MGKLSWEKVKWKGSLAAQIELYGPFRYFVINWETYQKLLELDNFRQTYNYCSYERPFKNEVGNVGPYRYFLNRSQNIPEKEIPCIKTFLKLHQE